MHIALNKIRSKYLIKGALRTAHFWGQISVETDRLRTVSEYASGADYEGRLDLGNIHAGDGIRFKGRGVIQLTGRGLYNRYGSYRSRDYINDQNPLQLRDDSYTACDASGFYWMAEQTRDRIPNANGNGLHWVLDGLININRRADRRTFADLQDTQRIADDVLNVTRQVNRAALHVELRRTFFKAAYYAVSDETDTAPNVLNQRPLTS